MKTAFLIASGLTGIFVAYGYPLVAILRGKRVLRTVVIGWGLLFIYMFSLCFLIPMLVSVFSRDLANEMWRSWVPEGPAVAAIAIMGWMPPLMAVVIGMVIKSALNRFWPATLKRIEAVGKKDGHVA